MECAWRIIDAEQGMLRCGLVAVRFETAKKTAAVGGCTARFLTFN